MLEDLPGEIRALEDAFAEGDGMYRGSRVLVMDKIFIILVLVVELFKFD